MKRQLLITTTLALLGCQDQNHEETEIRALRAQIDTLSQRLAAAQANIAANHSAVSGWSAETTSLWAAVIENQNELLLLNRAGVLTEDTVETAIATGSGSLGELASRVANMEHSYTDAATAITATAAIVEKVHVNGDGDVIFRDTNVVIQNGTGASGSLNAKGNLIIGYNETTGDLDRTGSHNLIIGDGHVYSAHSGLIAGEQHSLLAPHSAAIGGIGSQLEAEYTTALGGRYNQLSGRHAATVGGSFNTADGESSTAIGGSANTADGHYATASGGQSNTVSGSYSMAAGGSMNTIDGESSTIAGGHALDVADSFSVAMVDELDSIVGDLTSSLDAISDVVEITNTAQDEAIEALAYSTVAIQTGLDETSATLLAQTSEISAIRLDVDAALSSAHLSDTAAAEHAAQLDDLETRVTEADSLMQYISIDARGDVVFTDTNILVTNGAGDTAAPNGKGNLFVGYNAYDGEDRSGSHNIVVGDHNAVTGTSGLIVGSHHLLSGHGSAIIGGDLNTVHGDGSVTIGGYSNDVSGTQASALGGAHNQVSGTLATVIGGYANLASGYLSTAGPGRENVASGPYSAALGGALNTASGDSSTTTGGYADRAEETFDMGTVSDLDFTMTAESGRLSDTVAALSVLIDDTDELSGRFDTVEDHISAIETTSTALESATAVTIDELAAASSARELLADEISAVLAECNADTAEISVSLAALSTADTELSTSLTDNTVTLAAVATHLESIDTEYAAHAVRMDALDTDAESLESGLAAATSAIDTLESQSATNTEALDSIALHQARAERFLNFVSVEDDGDIIFSDTNIHLVNGAGDTHSANAKGNLVIGYNNSETYDEDRTGSHNIVIGDLNAYSATGGIVAGEGHTISGESPAAIGGEANTISASGAIAMGGLGNNVSQTGAASVGGQFSTVSGGWAAVLGGAYSTADAINSTVIGGHSNTATGDQSVIVGGYGNSASASHATAIGGSSSEASEAFAIAPIDTMNDSIQTLEDFIEDLGDDISEDIADNEDRISSVERSVGDLEDAALGTEDEMDSLSVGIAVAQLAISTLQPDVEDLKSEDTEIWESIEDLDNSRDVADNLLTYVSVSSTGDIVFDDTNIVLRNGTGTTDGETNGKGNLVIGYNEIDDDSARVGSHNMVLGMANSYSSFGGIIAGYDNVQRGEYSSILGGTDNLVTGSRAVIVSGQSNIASGENSVAIAGSTNEAEAQGAVTITGQSNVASGIFSTVTAGSSNDTSGLYAAVVGGDGNEAAGQASVVLSGQFNLANARSSAIVAGTENTTNGNTSAILAGWTNRTGSPYAGILSGFDNDADGDYSAVIGGFKSDATHTGSAVAGAYVGSTGLYTVDY